MCWSCSWGVTRDQTRTSEGFLTDLMLCRFLLRGFCWSVCPHFLQEFGASHTGWIPQETCLSPIMLCCCCWRRGWEIGFHPLHVLAPFLPTPFTCPELIAIIFLHVHLFCWCFIQGILENPAMFIILILFKCDVKQQNIHSDNVEIQGYFTRSCSSFLFSHICASIIVLFSFSYISQNIHKTLESPPNISKTTELFKIQVNLWENNKFSPSVQSWKKHLTHQGIAAGPWKTCSVALDWVTAKVSREWEDERRTEGPRRD